MWMTMYMTKGVWNQDLEQPEIPREGYSPPPLYVERQPKPVRRNYPILSELRLRIRAIVPHRNGRTCVFLCVAYIAHGYFIETFKYILARAPVGRSRSWNLERPCAHSIAPDRVASPRGQAAKPLGKLVAGTMEYFIQSVRVLYHAGMKGL